MSPEQCRGGDVDRRTDVYAFGVMIYEMLAGQLPFYDPSHIEVMMMHLSRVPPRLSEVAPILPSLLDEPVQRMLAKEPSARPGSLAEALHELGTAARAAGIDVEVPSMTSRSNAGSTGGAGGRAGQGGASANSTAPTLADTGSSRTMAAQMLAARPPRRVPVWVWGAGVVGLITGAAVLLARGGREPTEPTEPTVSAVLPAAPRPEAAAPASSVTLTLVTDPEEVEVFQGAQRLGASPGPVRVLHGTASVPLTFSAAGHESKTVHVVPANDMELSVRLTPSRSPSPHVAASHAVTPPPRAPAKKPPGPRSKELEF
jgi:serine/threonine-protein kinase